MAKNTRDGNDTPPTTGRDGEGDPFQLLPLKDLVLKTLTLCSEKFKSHGIQIETGELDAKVMVRCQPVRFSQVLVNLFNNAFDALDHLPAARRKALILTTRGMDDGGVELAVAGAGGLGRRVRSSRAGVI